MALQFARPVRGCAALIDQSHLSKEDGARANLAVRRDALLLREGRSLSYANAVEAAKGLDNALIAVVRAIEV